MLLAVAATEIEMQPLLSMRPPDSGVSYRLSGVGPLEAAVRLTSHLARLAELPAAVLNFGVAGAYLPPAPGDTMPEVLDVCLAEREVFGDFGIAFGERVEPFATPDLGGVEDLTLDPELALRAGAILSQAGVRFHRGPFVTVAAASGTADRGRFLQQRHRALCENMEGAALARACREFGIPLVECRVISNLVEDRPGRPWQLQPACRKSAEMAGLLLDHLPGALL